jgi:predicted enzyme related to lactoylglutathione lyase
MRLMPLLPLLLIAGCVLVSEARAAGSPTDRDGQRNHWAVGSQYDSTHVYLAPEDLDRFVDSFIATFGGTASPKAVVTVTPTPSVTTFRFLVSPVGTLSVFGFKTPIPYPFGAERTGYLVTELDAAVRAAQADGAALIVAPFADAIGRDAVIQWPGGVNMQLYWHTKPPSAPPLQTIPENRVYVSTDKAGDFIRAFLKFSSGRVLIDDPRSPGIEIGRPGDFYRMIAIDSRFGKMRVMATDGHLPYPYGRELTGYETADVSATLDKAQTSGASVLIAPYRSRGRQSAILQFPGGHIAEIHSATSP